MHLGLSMFHIPHLAHLTSFGVPWGWREKFIVNLGIFGSRLITVHTLGKQKTSGTPVRTCGVHLMSFYLTNAFPHSLKISIASPYFPAFIFLSHSSANLSLSVLCPQLSRLSSLLPSKTIAQLFPLYLLPQLQYPHLDPINGHHRALPLCLPWAWWFPRNDFSTLSTVSSLPNYWVCLA